MSRAEEACRNPGLVLSRYGNSPLTGEQNTCPALFSTVAARDAYYACPNVYSVRGVVEMDFLTVTRKHLAYEWETKHSRADFRKDAEKEAKRRWYALTAATGRPCLDTRGGFIPNRYYMVLVDGDRWLKDEDWELIPPYASVYIVKQTPIDQALLVKRRQPADLVMTSFHLVKRGKNLHNVPLPPARLQELWHKMMYRTVGSPALTQAFKRTHDHYEI